MRKKLIILTVLLLVAIPVAHAVIPLIVAGDIAVDLVGGYIIRSVGRQAIITYIPRSAATLASELASWANVGRLVSHISTPAPPTVADAVQVPKTIETSLNSTNSDMTVAPNDQRYTAPFTVSAAYSSTGAFLSMPNRREYSGANVTEACNVGLNWMNQNAKAGVTFTLSSVDTTYLRCYVSPGGFMFTAALNNYEQLDNVKRVKFNGSKWAADPTDPDWASVDAAKINQVSGLRLKDSVNNSAIDLTYDQAAGLRINYYEDLLNGFIDQFQALLNGSSFVQAVENTQYQGQIPQVIQNITNNNNGGNTTVNIDTSNLAKTGEAAAAALPLANKLDQLHADMTGSGTLDSSTPINGAVASLDQHKTNIEGLPSSVPAVDYSWLPSLMPGTVQACQPLPLDYSFNHGLLSGLSGVGNIDICDKLDLVRQILGYIFGVFTVFFIYRRFTRSNTGA